MLKGSFFRRLSENWLLIFSSLALIISVPFLGVNASDNDRREDFAPSVSPNGKQVVYYSYRGKAGSLPDLFIYDLEAGVERQLTNTPDLWEIEPRWLPNGTLIHFSTGPSMAELSLQVIRPDGKERAALSTGGGEGPAYWSPDSRFLAMRTPYDSDGVSQLMIYEPATDAVRIIDTGLQGENTIPTWSPDGQHLVFSHRDAGQKSGAELYRISIHGGVPDRLTRNNMEEFKTSWSTDGKTIFFMANGDGEPVQIYRVSAFGGATVRVSSEENAPAYFPQVSRDGALLYFSGTTESGEARIMRLPVTARGEKASEIEHIQGHSSKKEGHAHGK